MVKTTLTADYDGCCQVQTGQLDDAALGKQPWNSAFRHGHDAWDFSSLFPDSNL